MKSASAKGQYWKTRTKKFLEHAGYAVAYLEAVHYIYTPKGRIPVKRDQFASDLMAMNRIEIVFVQVKGGDHRRDHLADAKAAFAGYPFPAGTKQWVVLWAPRARAPEIVVVSEGPCGPLERELAPAPRRRRRDVLPLFARA